MSSTLKTQISLKKLVALYGSEQYPQNEQLKYEIDEAIKKREQERHQKLKRRKLREQAYRQSFGTIENDLQAGGIGANQSLHIMENSLNTSQFEVDREMHNKTTIDIRRVADSEGSNDALLNEWSRSLNHSKNTLISNLRSNSQLNFGRNRSKIGLSGHVSSSMEMSSSTLGFKSEFKPKSYHNVTGPGDYNIPSLTGYQSIVAGRRNGPKFSFGSRPEKIQFFSKEYLRNFMGKESEDAGYNIISTDVIKHSEPKISIPKEPRFKEPTITQYKGQLPVFYQSLHFDDKKQERKNQQYKSIGMGYGKRSDFTIQPQLVENPGPADYEHTNKITFKHNESEVSLNKSRMTMMDESPYNNQSASKLPGITISKAKRDTDHYSKNMYTQNMEYRLMGQDSPGPAVYKQEVNISWSPENQYLSRNLTLMPKMWGVGIKVSRSGAQSENMIL
ncbi:UNKNOWN [Stylonychia lemnae]|uniref:Uncharacterized protein n=1 Tax=Stylonychia lemnae TaxID=5949 RepID=A0A078AU82_STYLE|nr:UNKNOWN [Stylonychia lemnae]|eukprot:CDW85551.1 UNKNOWN [Stylonychia lemnae]